MGSKKSRNLAVALLLIAALALTSWMENILPSREDILYRPFRKEVDAGQSMSLDTMDVVVLKTHTARNIDYFRNTYSTTGVFVVVDLAFRPIEEPVALRALEVEASSGNTYGAGPATPACHTGQTGIPIACRVAFEVAREDLVGLRLLIPASGLEGGAGELLAVADLGITEDSPLLTSPKEIMEIIPGTYWEMP